MSSSGNPPHQDYALPSHGAEADDDQQTPARFETLEPQPVLG